jgi:NADPH-dependent ferric siderophore reductase
VQVVAEVADAASRQELPDRPGTEVVWCHRDGAEPGTTTLLLDAVRALPPLPPATYVWGGGESRTLAKVRRHVRDERGLDRESVGLITYWRRDA